MNVEKCERYKDAKKYLNSKGLRILRRKIRIEYRENLKRIRTVLKKYKGEKIIANLNKQMRDDIIEMLPTIPLEPEEINVSVSLDRENHRIHVNAQIPIIIKGTKQ